MILEIVVVVLMCILFYLMFASDAILPKFLIRDRNKFYAGGYQSPQQPDPNFERRKHEQQVASMNMVFCDKGCGEALLHGEQKFHNALRHGGTIELVNENIQGQELP
jgi:hypothetical protein